MELKDVILSTLAEMEDVTPRKESPKYEVKETHIIEETKVLEDVPKVEKPIVEEKEIPDNSSPDSELIYLSSIKERLLVLFEGFQAPNNANIEAKVDMTLNFLEYTLATIDTRIELLEKGKR